MFLSEPLGSFRHNEVELNSGEYDLTEKGCLHDWLTLHLTQGVGPGTILRLVRHFTSPRMALNASRRELLKVPGVRQDAVDAVCRNPAYAEAEAELKKCEGFGVSIVTWGESDYPEDLSNIHNPPPVLYVRGRREFLRNACVGIVGARAASSYGLRTAENLAFGLGEKGYTVVSGLALGIDAAAHSGALRAKAKTIAVLGCGLDVIYPRNNRKLYERIAEEGVLVSEYPLGTSPDGFRFPARNRIISGLSLGVVVVEAAKRSGSLITADLALEQGREVFAVPGRVDSVKSTGTHKLLKEGAKLVHSLDDVIEELPFHRRPEARKNSLAREQKVSDIKLKPDEEKIYSYLEVYPKSIDEIVRGTMFPVQKVSEILLLLELEGVIEALPGKQYQLNV